MNCAISSCARASQRRPFSAVASVASPVTPDCGQRAPVRHVRERAVAPVHPHVLRLRRDLLDRAFHLHEARARSRDRATSRARRRAPCRRGRTRAAPRAAAWTPASTRYQHDAQIAAGCSTLTSRAAMSTSGWFEPCPLTIRMRSKPWWQSERPRSSRYSTKHVPAQRDGAGEVQVVWRVAVHRGRETGVPSPPAALTRSHAPARDLLDQAHVGVDRQVVAVILERRRRDHDDDVVARGELGSSGHVCCS